MQQTITIVFVLFYSFLCSAQNKDVEWLQSIHTGNSASWDRTNKIVSQSMFPVSAIVPVGIFTYGLLKKDSISKREGLIVGAGIAGSAAITIGMKYVINRERPFKAYPLHFQNKDVGGGPSFPSGHTSSAFATATSLTLFHPKWYIIAPSFLWATAVGYSRMELGVHYPSDVLVGAILGAGCAWLCWKINGKD